VLRMTVLVKRHPNLDVDEFHARWREHGRIIAEEPLFRGYIRRYEQHHRVPADYRNGDTFDGVAVQDFDDYAAFLAFLQTPEYAAKVQPDEATLIDIDRIVVLFTEEPEVVIP
jgi:EthD domain